MSRARRRFFRVPVSLQAEVLVPGRDPMPATVADISADGLGFVIVAADPPASARVRRRLASGAPLDAQVTLGGRPLVLRGTVAWVRTPEGTTNVLAGIQLTGADAPTRKALKSWLVEALAALQDAAQQAMYGRWPQAAASLKRLGIEAADPKIVLEVLRYADAGRVDDTPGSASA